MASASMSGVDSFLAQVEIARDKIGEKFRRAHQVLLERESALLSELQRLEARYRGEEVTEQIREIKTSKEQLIGTMKGNENQQTLAQSVALLDARIRELEIGLETVKDGLGSVVFEWDGELERILSETGVIRVGVRTVLGYRKKGEPVKTACKYQKEMTATDAVFNYPTSIVISPQSENIYISDSDADSIQVFTKSFEFLFKFSEKMDIPSGMCISQNKLFIIQTGGHCLNLYSIDGNFLNSVGKKGNKELEFDCPTNLSVSPVENRIYICDLRNHRIQCLNSDLTFHSIIPNITTFRIHCTSDEIIALRSKRPFISFYNYSHQLVREILSSTDTPIDSPFDFCIDSQNNILIVDDSAHCVLIFSNNGELVHKFGQEGEGRGEFINPTAIALDSENMDYRSF